MCSPVALTMRIADVFQTKWKSGTSALAGMEGPEAWTAGSRLKVSLQLRTDKSVMSMAAMTRLYETIPEDVW